MTSFRIRADLVLSATREHRAQVVTLVPDAAGRTFTLREFSPDGRRRGAGVRRVARRPVGASPRRGHGHRREPGSAMGTDRSTAGRRVTPPPPQAAAEECVR
jgi:protein-tyrosine phosphatase